MMIVNNLKIQLKIKYFTPNEHHYHMFVCVRVCGGGCVSVCVSYVRVRVCVCDFATEKSICNASHFIHSIHSIFALFHMLYNTSLFINYFLNY